MQRRVNRTWLPDLLPLSIDSCDQLAVFYYTVSCNIQELHLATFEQRWFGEVLLVRDCAIENGELNRVLSLSFWRGEGGLEARS